MPISVNDQNAFIQAEINTTADLTKSTGTTNATQDAQEMAQMKAIVDNNKDSFSPSAFTAINDAYTKLNSDFLGHASTEQTEKDLMDMVAQFGNAKFAGGGSLSVSTHSQGADPYALKPEQGSVARTSTNSKASGTDSSASMWTKPAAVAEQDLQAGKKEVKNNPNVWWASQDLGVSYMGYKAEHPGTTVDQFAAQEAPKLGLTVDQVKNSVNEALKGWESDGANSETALEGKKGKIDQGGKATKGDPEGEGDTYDMARSYRGYAASHPNATLDDFAKQEAPKVGLTADQVKQMVQRFWQKGGGQGTVGF